jgi:hypothetical protein
MARFSVRHLTSSIYGTVLTIALITAYSADDELDPLLIAAGVVVTTAVFWLAHAQAELLARRYFAGRALGRDEVEEQLREGWPMVEASFPCALALAAGGIGVLDEDASIYVALGIGVLELAGWGIAIGQREQLGLVRVVALTSLNVALGLAVVVLKLVIH